METPLTTVPTHQVIASAQADGDEQLIGLWLHGRGPATTRAYRGDVDRFKQFISAPLRAVTLGDLQSFADSLVALSPASQSRHLAAIKSLFAFGHKLGYLQFDPARVI